MENRDEPLLFRSRVYLGVRSRFDPLRFAVEFQDARRYNSQYPLDNRDVDKMDFIQAFAELRFPDTFGTDARGLRLYGRTADTALNYDLSLPQGRAKSTKIAASEIRDKGCLNCVPTEGLCQANTVTVHTGSLHCFFEFRNLIFAVQAQKLV